MPERSAREIELASDQRGALHLIASVQRPGLAHDAPTYEVALSTYIARPAAAK
jgi:hypothetical protein